MNPAFLLNRRRFARRGQLFLASLSLLTAFLLWAPSAGADAGLGDDPASTTVTTDTVALDASERDQGASAEVVAEPATEPPLVGETAADPMAVQPTVGQVIGSETGTDPAATDPAATDPAATDPATTDPATTDPATTDPATTDPATTDPATTDPAATDPAPTDPAPTDPLASTDEPAPPEEPVVPPAPPADVEAPAAAPAVIPGEAIQAVPPNDEAIDIDVGGDDVAAGPAPTPEPPVLPSQGPVDGIAVPTLPSVGLPSALASNTAPDTAPGLNGPTRGPVVTRELGGGGVANATARSNDRRSAALASYRLPVDGGVGSATERPRPAGRLVEQAPTPAAAAGQAPAGGSSSGGSAAGLLAIMAAFLFAACNLLLGRRLGLTVNAATGASVAIKLKRPG